MAVDLKVEARYWPEQWLPLSLPWQLVQDGLPIAFYATEALAESSREDTQRAFDALETMNRVGRR